jgi:hypothetical protein
MNACLQFSELLQTFFTDRLTHQRQASPHTVASYRDTFRLLLRFAQEQTGKQPTKLTMEDLDAVFCRKVPAPSRKRPRPQRPQPKYSLSGNSLLLSIRSSHRAGLQRLGPACLGHTRQALRPKTDQLSDSA